MKFYVAMFLVLGVVLLLIPTANMSLISEDENSAASAPQEQETQEQEAQGQQSEQIPQNPEEKEVSANPFQDTDASKEKPNVSSDKTNAAQAKTAATKMEKETFNILNRTTGKIDTVTVKDYVRGALSAEMPPSFQTEALKAQAVSAHTYALNMQKEAEKVGRDYDFSADPSDWKGYVTEAQAKERFGKYFEEYWGKLSKAADSVCGKIMVYDDEPIAAAYHAISAGTTEAAVEVWGNPVEYLTPVDSIGDLRAPGFEETVTLTAEETKKAISKAFPEIDLQGEPETWFTIDTRSESGYITKVTAGDTEITGLELREALDLRSSNMTIDCKGKQFTFTTKGYGHGVGLSQYGADYMARQGADYEDILKHYYPGAELQDRA